MSRPKLRAAAEFVRMPASDEQLLALWSKVERGARRRRARARQLRRGAASGALLAVLAGALWLTASGDEPAPLAARGAATESAAGPAGDPSGAADLDTASDAPRELALADGSHLSLGAGARARVLVMRADEVRLRLERGEVECEVEPARERRFVVEAGPFEVVVTGTRFRVAADGDEALASRVAVSVERGSVEVREPSGRLLAALTAGQRWASERPLAPVDPPDAGRPAPPAPAPATPRKRDAAPQAAPPRAAAAPRAGGRQGAVALLARASEARAAGQTKDAAAALEQLRREHPQDERAGYAAFLLGRIQLDALGDARGAVESFGFAVAHPGSGFFVEDAEARLIEALARAGRSTECARARDRFLARHPSSPRAASIREACRAK